MGDGYPSVHEFHYYRLLHGVYGSTEDYPHQLIIVPTQDLVLLDGLGRRWLVVLPPIPFLISATVKCSISSTLLVYPTLYAVAKITAAYYQYYYINAPEVAIFLMLYIPFLLATTLWCTLLIIYRILTVAGVKRGADGRLNVYQHFIEVFVESSALYSISMIVYLALTIRESFGLYYLDVIAGIAKVRRRIRLRYHLPNNLSRELLRHSS